MPIVSLSLLLVKEGNGRDEGKDMARRKSEGFDWTCLLLREPRGPDHLSLESKKGPKSLLKKGGQSWGENHGWVTSFMKQTRPKRGQ